MEQSKHPIHWRWQLPSFAVASWLTTCLALATLMLPTWVSAQGDAASPVVETTTPTATSLSTETVPSSPVPPATPGEVSGAAGSGVGNEDFDNIGSFTTFKILPELGMISPGGTTQWVVDFSGLWGIENSETLDLVLQFSWAGTSSDLACAGNQCSGSPWQSGPTTVSQNYNKAAIFSGRLLVTWPNPTAPDLYHVYATMTATSDGPRPIVSTAQKTLNFAVMPSLTPSPSPTALTGSPVPTEDVGSDEDRTPTAPAPTEESNPAPSEAANAEPPTGPSQGAVRSLPNTGANDGRGDSSSMLPALLAGACLAMLACAVVGRRRRP